MPFKLQDWLPQALTQGPPLPSFIKFFWPWYKPPVTAPKEGLGITLYDQYGRIVAQAGLGVQSLAMPATPVEGDTLSARLSVTNTTYQVLGGVNTPVPATLTIKVFGSAGSTTLIPTITKSLAFGAGQTLTVSPTDPANPWSAVKFTLPAGTGGTLGSFTAQLLDPTGTVLSQGVASFNISKAPIVYGGTITIG